MRFNSVITVLFLCSALLAGCSSGKKKAACNNDEAYRLGQAQAELIIECDDEEALQDSLLEIRSRIYHIAVNVGEEQAREFERGFVDYVRQHGDSIAQEIF